MQIIHLFWRQTSNDFNNTGCLYLWLEQGKNAKTKAVTSDSINKELYPFQAPEESLVTWFSEHFSRFLALKKPTLTKEVAHDASIEKVLVQLPCDHAGRPIPSPIIANLSVNEDELEDSAYAGMASFILNGIKIQQPLAFLKELNFQSYYFEDELQLADDAKFWLKMAAELSTLIQKDQYIPFLIAQKVKTKVAFHTKWQPLSAEYQQRLGQIAPLMPFSACMADEALQKNTDLVPIALLQHFSEVVLNELINSTAYPNTVHKQLQGSFIANSFNFSPTQTPVSEPQWKSWRLWHNNLNYDQFGSPFQLCFRLNEATSSNGIDWGLEVLLQAKADPSFMINLAEFWQDKATKQAFFSKMLGTSIERNLLLQLGYACRIYPLLEQVFAQNMQQPLLVLTTDQAFDFLKEDAWALHACGYKISVPSWWTASGRVRAKINIGILVLNHPELAGDLTFSQKSTHRPRPNGFATR